MKEVAVLASGGLDSTVLMIDYLEKGHSVMPLFCDYGQKMIMEERRAVYGIISELEQMYERRIYPLVREIDLGTLGPSRLTGRLRKGDFFRYQGVHEAYVPSRDTIMLLHAASYLELNQVTTIALGTHKTDADNAFPDCTPVISKMVEDLLNCSTSLKTWKIETPFINMTKQEIRSKVSDNKYEKVLSMVFSGYGPHLEY